MAMFDLMFQKLRQYTFIRSLGLMPSYIRWIFYPAMIVNQAVWTFFMNLILAFIMKDVLDAAVQGDIALLERAVYLAASAMFIGAPSGCFFSYVTQWCMKRTMTAIRKRTFTAVTALTMNTFEQRHSGDMISRMTNDIDATERVFWEIANLVSAFMYGVGAMGAIFVLDWRFGLLALGMGLMAIAVEAGFAKPLRRISDVIQAAQGVVTERLTDLIQSIPVVKMFHLETRIHTRYTTANADLVTGYLNRAHIDGLYRSSDELLGYLTPIGSLIFGLYLILNGDSVSIGTIAAIIHLQGNAEMMFGNIGNFLTGIQKALAGAHRVFEVIDSPGEETAEIAAVPKISAESQTRIERKDQPVVTMQDLRFGYQQEDGSEQDALQNINIRVAEGNIAAMVGPSGGGKSTLIKLLLGFYPVTDGAISIHGRSISTYTLPALRSIMAYVPQDAYIFDGTIEDNIRYGRYDATQEDIMAASRAAHAHEFILAQPEGYATKVGERGARLSGGQRQRIAIARALLKDAPILLLDEATSALDSEFEQLVQDALDVLMEGRTTIAIAHRLSTIEHADVIYVLDQGQVVEEGTHLDLLKREGLYHRLHQLQFLGKELIT